MARSLADLFVTVSPDLEKFEPEFKKKFKQIERAAEKQGQDTGKRFGSGMSGALKTGLAAGIGGVAASVAGLGLGNLFTSFISGAQESARIARQTEAVIKSTGGAARITADQVGSLAEAISAKTGADDEAIQSGANLLLTFTNIRNGVGRGNDIFNQATSTITDMTAALNNGAVTSDGLKTSSIQLGKALNDPIKGVGALSRVGVSFTEQQKKQIKTLVDSGKTMEAQKIILGELQKEFGGAAVAAADPLTRLQTIAGNLGEDIGGLLLPHVERFANFLSARGVPAIQGFLAGLEGKGQVAGFSGALNTAGLGMRALVRAFKEGDVTSDGVVGSFEEVGVTARALWARLKEVGAGVRDVAKWFADHTTVAKVAAGAIVGLYVGIQVYNVAVRIAAGVTAAWTAVQKAASAATVVWTGVKKVAAATTILWTGAQKAGAAATVLWTGVQRAAAASTILWTGAQKAAILVARGFAAAQLLVNAAMRANPIGAVITIITALVAIVVLAYNKNETFRKIVQAAWKGIKDAASSAWNSVLKPVFNFIIGYYKFMWEGAVKAWNVIRDAWNKINSIILGAWRNFIKPTFDNIVRTWLNVAGSIISGAARAFGWVPGVGDKLKGAERRFQAFRDSVNRSIGGIQDKNVGIGAKITFPAGWQEYRRGERGYAVGGAVRGPGSGTSDDIPAMLSNGEHVWTAKEVAAAGGHGAVEAMRAAVISGIGFATGGRVGLNIRANLPDRSQVVGFAGRIESIFERAAISFGQRLQKEYNAGGGRALGWARSQAGKPYIWGGVGPAGYDCSGFMSAITNIIQGRAPYSRRFATGNFPTSDFARGPGRFMIGSRRGNPGHMAGTLGGVNVESRGGDGVVIGSRARGAFNGLFGGNVWHLRGYASGGRVEGDAPFDLLNPRGRSFMGQKLREVLFGDRAHFAFANGGMIREPILGMGLNSGASYSFGERGPERVLPGGGGGPVFINRGVVTTSDVENWFTGVYDNVKRKGRV